MTEKTVAEVVKEYLNRKNRTKMFFIMFLNDGRRDGYLKVTNIVRDGVKIDFPSLDKEYHKYEFDYGFQPTTLEPVLEWTHCVFTGKIIEYSYKIEE